MSRRVVATVATVICLFAAPASAWADPPPVPPTTPDTSACPYRVHPAAPVDASEVVPAGQAAPAPLPVPSPAVGGEKLSACGVIQPDGDAPLPAGITSAGWIVADLDSRQVIVAKDPHGRYRPASTIKVLLALVVLDRLSLSMPVTATDADYQMEGDACGVGPGAVYTVHQLLQGLLMVSGNDCANALARTLGGYEVAVGLMNEKAATLGAQDTRVASPSGLDAPGMSTSPYDLAVIFAAAMTNPEFRGIVAQTTAQFPGHPKVTPEDTDHPAYPMFTQNRLVADGYPGALGGKTGYTDDALKTYVGVVERNGRRLVLAQMYGVNLADDSYWGQTTALFDHGFAARTGASVGTLVTGPPRPQRSEEPTTAGERRPAAQPRSASSSTSRVTLGVIGAVVALTLVAAGLIVIRRSRR
ncbi:D-alanyl-D-alanine carboxypeptidase family protein [Williamsia sterculiae]|uniref:D-alanyl-D-alanine carboxypeptidase (Penicillin-binding protein 5/6) n=1 Tax=Williamsia sterculiae TaxID=1344003 RepID=A0A1N7DX31_9NOCA|nr:serine hydrolase [Williamsia sterculiae]SIR80235.1 D-alanyl-D-alanine carboxypeptidase (penicillin-binding protein 5/6) [Williamsia sterculiae]